jgi:cob(I)alamin adenosyltransferase
VKIYTRTGDEGQTGLFDGTRVSKADARVAAYGEIDELNAALGVARAAGVDAQLSAVIIELQRDLHAVGARLADPRHTISHHVDKVALTDAHVRRLEQVIDEAERELPPLRHFILAGGSPAGAALHLARTICRRAERHVVALGPDAVDPVVLTFVNRLSDLLFVLARLVNHRAGAPETEWYTSRRRTRIARDSPASTTRTSPSPPGCCRGKHGLTWLPCTRSRVEPTISRTRAS